MVDETAPTEVREPNPGRIWRRIGCGTVIAVLLLLLAVVARIVWLVHRGPELVISPETTVVDGPLTSDGYINYAAAVNKQRAEEVTPETNAAVPLLRASGPGVLPRDNRAMYYDLLGMEPPPHSGASLSDVPSLCDVLAESSGGPVTDELERECSVLYEHFYDDLQDRPWRRDEFPVVADWLDRHETPLEGIIQATRRPHYFVPYVDEDEPPSLLGAFECVETRKVARLLRARAMLRVGEGEIAAAQRDLLAMRRLGRLETRRGELINYFIGGAVESVAWRGEITWLHQGNPSREQVLDYLSEFDRLAPRMRVATIIDRHERYYALDVVQLLMRYGGGILFDTDTELQERCLETFVPAAFDWDEVMRIVNEHYDATAAALRADTYQERLAELPSVEFATAKEFDANRSIMLVLHGLVGNRRTASEEIGVRLVQFTSIAGEKLVRIETRHDAEDELLRIACALAAWQADHGRYPDTLDVLAPELLPKIPLDPFSDRLFRYESTGEGYRLYSVGYNQIDDGGATRASKPPGDDILVDTAVDE